MGKEVIYVEQEAIVKLIFAPAIVPLITRLEQQFTSMSYNRLAAYQVPMLFVYMKSLLLGEVLEKLQL
jgi:plasmid replication initiation protein